MPIPLCGQPKASISWFRAAGLGSDHALGYFSPRDGRLMFLIPWGDFSIIGTTDTDYKGDPGDVYADAS